MLSLGLGQWLTSMVGVRTSPQSENVYILAHIVAFMGLILDGDYPDSTGAVLLQTNETSRRRQPDTVISSNTSVLQAPAGNAGNQVIFS